MRVALILDEMHSPLVASALRERGHDVVSVADDPDLRAMSDEALWVWACHQKRRIVTENVKDFRPLLLRAEEAGQPAADLLFTSGRRFPRSRRNPGPLIDALDGWLRTAAKRSRPAEDWLIGRDPS